MRVLMLTPYLPYPLLSGGQIRTYNLLKKLSDKHEITLFALIKDESERLHIPELEKYCASVQVFKRSNKPFTLGNILRTAVSTYPFLVIRNHVQEVISAVEKELSQKNYDLIHAETFYMMPHIPQTTVPKLLVEQTIEYLGYESYAQQAPALIRPILQIDIEKIKRWERHYWNSCDRLIVMSNDDQEFIASQLENPQKIAVVANGVDTEWFAQKRRKRLPKPTVLSVGTFKWLPNVEAVNFLVKQVWPHIQKKLPSAHLWIVGNAPTDQVLALEQHYDNITVTGNIPDIRDAFTGAHVLVAPVFSGKGTRYKVLEAMAAGTPIVSTETAVEGLGVTPGIHVLVSNTPTGIANHTLHLLQDAERRQQLAKNGKRFVREHFDWELISKKLDTVYQTMGIK